MIPTFTKYQIRGLLVQLTKIDYVTPTNPQTMFGRYRIPDIVLQAKGYRDANNNWLGKNAVRTTNTFVLSTGLQDTIMADIVQRLYLSLINNGTIQDGDPTDVAAGLLLVAYFLMSWYPYEITAAEAARQWKLNALSPDNIGSAQYFNYGRYAVNQLSTLY
jgi:hypothetical protein